MNHPIAIIGSGISGLNFALNTVRQRDIVILTKKETCQSNTNYAQGGIAAVLSKLDSFEQHVADTLKAGSYHNNEKAVRFMVERGPSVIRNLLNYGIDFDTYKGKLALTKEGGHSKNRIAYKGDYTGKEIEEGLIRNVKKMYPRIKVIEHAFCTDLECQGGRIRGIHYIKDGVSEFLPSCTVVIATGGIGQLYKYTTNPPIATGDGIAMASRVGAKVQDTEFVQFHPTVFIPPNGRPFLVSEAVRGEGAFLINEKGDRFTDELSSRDKVSYDIFRELKKGPVYLDITHKPSKEIKLRFPAIYKELKSRGLDITRDRIPVRPAAHYLCGGIATDLKGQTSVPGLYAFGEAAYTGVHGANRLASNSLLEALVFSREIESHCDCHCDYDYDYNFNCNYDFNYNLDVNERIESFRDLMWNKAGLVRNLIDLKSALKQIESRLVELYKPKGTSKNVIRFIEYRNMLTTGRHICQDALARPKSLGCHLIQ